LAALGEECGSWQLVHDMASPDFRLHKLCASASVWLNALKLSPDPVSKTK
jgi:hypothetical protein